jgi:hypothetical protein
VFLWSSGKIYQLLVVVKVSLHSLVKEVCHKGVTWISLEAVGIRLLRVFQRNGTDRKCK